MFKETRTRSVVKALFWRLIVFVADFSIAYLILGSYTLATKLALIKVVVSFFLYYSHERIWDKVRWGRKN